MQKRNGKWLIAVSTGPDSMALLTMALEEGMEIGCAFVNYGIRLEAKEEEAYIRSFCEEKKIPLYVEYGPEHYSGNFEAMARTIRYDFFKRIVEEEGYEGVLIAQHEDDFLETYRMQEEKGITPEYYGLKEETYYKGMKVVRPLLHYTKKELENYCIEHHVQYYIDSTNEDESYTRNRIRHNEIEKLTPNERELLLKEIEKKNAILQERRCRMQAYASQETMQLSLYRQLEDLERLTYLRQIYQGDKNPSDAYLESVDSILLEKNDFIIPFGKMNLVQKEGEFFPFKETKSYNDIYTSLEEIQLGDKEGYRIEEGKEGVNAVTLKEEDFPLTIRNTQEGDYIHLRFGRKKVSRFFIDRHIPLYLRASWPVVVNAKGKIILVPGLGCDVNHYSITPTFNVLQLE